MNEQSGERVPVKACHVCQGTGIYYVFSGTEFRVVRCEDCGLVFLNPQPSDEELNRIDGTGYSSGNQTDEGSRAASELKQAAAKQYLSQILRYRGEITGRLLEVGCGDGDFLALAEADGWQVTGLEYSTIACDKARKRLKNGEVRQGELHQAGFEAEQFDVCVVSGALERVRSALQFLREVRRVLKPNGTLFLTAVCVNSSSAPLRRQNFTGFKAELLTYFDDQTLQTALFKSGFRDVIVQTAPGRTQRRHQPPTASSLHAFARKAELHPKQTLSVIVPVYNEAATFGVLMEKLLRKELPGIRMEIIVVESNSTDGSREAALKFKSSPGVKLIFEDQPRGKGHAVRAGLQAASGDYVLIQDADLEYDLEDYDALLEHLVSGRSAFVLGSRHGGRNVLKMRQFIGQRALSLFMNTGHWFFTILINVLFLQRLRDPFTMFKVFRRDCIFGLEFECNRFDFDCELVIKLIRKGYRPIELPVNYRSRSYKQGKKVRMIRDPLSWLRALAWLRFVKIDPMAIAERERWAKDGKSGGKS